jgi:tRNA(fMet)-specific endonuclease VapC
MLDTDTASYVVRGGRPRLDERIAAVPVADVCISAVTRAELLYGLRLKPGAERLARLVGAFLSRVRTVGWDETAADRFAVVAADLDLAGRRIGPFDTMIAAHALALGATLVTNNTAHFSRVAGLSIENWSA